MALAPPAPLKPGGDRGFQGLKRDLTILVFRAARSKEWGLQLPPSPLSGHRLNSSLGLGGRDQRDGSRPAFHTPQFGPPPGL